MGKGGCQRDEILGEEKDLGKRLREDRAKGTKKGEILFIHPSNKYLMSVYYMLGTVPRAEDTVAMETGKVLVSVELLF